MPGGPLAIDLGHSLPGESEQASDRLVCPTGPPEHVDQTSAVLQRGAGDEWDGRSVPIAGSRGPLVFPQLADHAESVDLAHGSVIWRT